jgi:hypothetical protein
MFWRFVLKFTIILSLDRILATIYTSPFTANSLPIRLSYQWPKTKWIFDKSTNNNKNFEVNKNDSILSRNKRSNYLDEAMSSYGDIKFSSIMEEENDENGNSECILENSYFYVFWWLNRDHSIKTINGSCE